MQSIGPSPDRPSSWPGALWLVALCLSTLTAFPHGDVHLQITELTQKIAATPDNPELYIRRGELYRLHRLWDAALADFETARTLPKAPETLDLSFGRLYVDAGWPETGRAVLTRFLKTHPDYGEAYVLRGRALVQLDLPLNAAGDFSAAIKASGMPRPELYIQRAQALTQAGPDHWVEALEGLDEGIEKLGPLVTLQLPAIEIELKRQSYDKALARLETVAAQSPRKESWLKRRGDILQLADRQAEAIRAYKEALRAIESLPPARRNVPAIQELILEITQLLKDSDTTPEISTNTP